MCMSEVEHAYADKALIIVHEAAVVIEYGTRTCIISSTDTRRDRLQLGTT